MPNEYKVLKIDELTRLGETEGVERYYRHKIKTKGGTILTVDISADNFEAAKAGPILLTAAQNADTVLKLGG